MDSWQNSLLQTLQSLKRKPDAAPRLAILGVGAELNGDDAAGVLIIRRLELSTACPELLILECGSVPENFTGTLRSFHPDYTLIIDAGDIGQAPGSVSYADWADADGMGFSTHSLPPSVFAEYLQHEIGSRLGLLLIQPKNVDFCAELCPEVRQTVGIISNELLSVFHRYFYQYE